VWVRRACWRIPTERTTTSAIVQLALALVLIAPATEPYTGRLFFELTGRWHIDNLLGCMLELGALVQHSHDDADADDTPIHRTDAVVPTRHWDGGADAIVLALLRHS
jgi:hypothetical protein